MLPALILTPSLTAFHTGSITLKNKDTTTHRGEQAAFTVQEHPLLEEGNLHTLISAQLSNSTGPNSALASFALGFHRS